jgi:hypothetical protein
MMQAQSVPTGILKPAGLGTAFNDFRATVGSTPAEYAQRRDAPLPRQSAAPIEAL